MTVSPIPRIPQPPRARRPTPAESAPPAPTATQAPPAPTPPPPFTDAAVSAGAPSLDLPAARPGPSVAGPSSPAQALRVGWTERARGHVIASVDIGRTRTCAVIAEVGDGSAPWCELRVLGVGQARFDEGAGGSSVSLDETAETVRRALKEAELMSGATVDRVYAGISGDHVEGVRSVGIVPLQEGVVDAVELDRVHGVACAVPLPPTRDLLHALPLDYAIDLERGVQNPLGRRGVRLETELYLVTCAREASDRVRAAIGKAGYRTQQVVAEPLASARAVLTEDEKEVGVLVVELGAATTGAAAFYRGGVRHLSVLPFGGTTVTRDLAHGLSLSFSEADRAKELHGAAMVDLVDPLETVELPGRSSEDRKIVPRELIAHVIEQRLDETLEMIRERLEREGHLERLPAGVVLTGGGAGLEGVVELAESVFGCCARLGVPGEGLTGLGSALARPRFATATGLALFGADRFRETGRGAATLTSGLVAKMGAWLKEFF